MKILNIKKTNDQYIVKLRNFIVLTSSFIYSKLKMSFNLFSSLSSVVDNQLLNTDS